MKRVLFLVAVSFFLTACSQTGLNKTTTGTLGGGAVGAGLGAIVGSQTGHAGPGIAIGTALGALGGALVGNQLDRQDSQTAALQDRADRQKQQLEENRRLIEELRQGGADAYASSRGVVVNLPDVLFHFDSTDLTYEARDSISEIARVTQKVKGRKIAIEGHTDSIGGVMYNKDLSIRRARSVAQELSYNKVERRRMNVVGYGESVPLASNNSEAGRAKNRRVEVIIEN